MKEQVYTNYRLQLPTEEVIGTLVVRDGIIADIQPGAQSRYDGEGEYLLPGLIELHTDHIEQCISPRPKVRWPLNAAVSHHDRTMAAAGITTVCDAIAIGDLLPRETLRKDSYAPIIEAITTQQSAGNLSVDHKLHLRCELSYDAVAEIVEDYVNDPYLTLVSLMDHTPGQRQFANLEKFREYYMGKHGLTADEMSDFIQGRIAAQQEHADKSREKLVALAKEYNLAIASHDDATPEHVEQAVTEGANISEFPTTIAAAKTAKANGLQVLMGAPNLVLGGSHSGNVSAMELVKEDLVDIISSDYVLYSLLQSIFVIAGVTGQPIYETMRPVTINSAIAIGLERDRGSLEVGKQADFLTVHYNQQTNVPTLTQVVKGGRRIA